MSIDRARRALLLGAACAASAGAVGSARSGGPAAQVLRLWPGEAPGLPQPPPDEQLVERPAAPGTRDRIVRGVRWPQLTLVRAARPDGSIALIVPGGGYRHVVVDKEGLELACWLAARGCTAAVLRYRLPVDGWHSGADAPLQDAQRALRQLLALPGSDAQRLGVIGFSAGGHVAARLACESAFASYAALDALDAQLARPSHAALIYPVITLAADDAHAGSRERLIGGQPTVAQIERYSVELQVTPSAPVTFLLHAADDTSVPVGNTLRMHAALRAARVPVEMHVYASGGHGFGLRAPASQPVADWPTLLWRWGASAGWFRPRGDA